MKLNLPVLITVITLTIVGTGVGYLLGYDHGFEKAVKQQVSSFEECKAAGYPILESFPEQCMTPEGKTFISEEQVACTADAKLCPDGSSVGRIPPSCEFAPCP